MQRKIASNDVLASNALNGRYVPPADWRAAAISELLSGTRRDTLEPKQIDWVNAVTTQQGGDSGKVFIAGDETLIKKRCIAVIGARKVSDLGRQRARKLGRQLAEHDVVVVSGLADGVDTEALSEAIAAGGHVIAVIGTPLDQAYPAKNKRLQESIYRDHLLISQFVAGTRVFPSNFPARNRTMAALADATVVIEASDSSGTLHQAAECVRLGRWLAIAKSVVIDPALKWPRQFLDYPKCLQLESTEQLISAVYG